MPWHALIRATRRRASADCRLMSWTPWVMSGVPPYRCSCWRGTQWWVLRRPGLYARTAKVQHEYRAKCL